MTLPLFSYYKNSILISLLLLAGTTSLLNADTLNVLVQDKNQIPKKYLRVDINPGGIVVYTDKAGRFTYNLKNGKYTIKINEFNRFMRFDIRVKNTTSEVFTLKW